MERNQFIEKLKYCGCHIKNRTDPLFDEIYYSDFQASKTFFEKLDFDCRIDENGRCKAGTRCCCDNCFDNAGYLRKVVDTDITKYARVFNTKTGFWRADKGCVLPHKLRSVTCLTTHCNHEKVPRGFSIMISMMRENLRIKSMRI